MAQDALPAAGEDNGDEPVDEGSRNIEMPEETAGKTGRIMIKLLSWAANLLLIALILSAILAAYLVGARDSRPRALYGFSAHIVLSDSMQSEIAQGSLLLVREAEPGSIRVGEDIAFLRADRSLVTHRVVGIVEDYEQSGMRGFVTQGLENPHPDSDTVYADNVVGRAVYHNLGLGILLSYIQQRVWLPVAAAALLIAFYYALRYLACAFKRPEEPIGI